VLGACVVLTSACQAPSGGETEMGGPHGTGVEPPSGRMFAPTEMQARNSPPLLVTDPRSPASFPVMFVRDSATPVQKSSDLGDVCAPKDSSVRNHLSVEKSWLIRIACWTSQG
jgi:hypothetical protein